MLSRMVLILVTGAVAAQSPPLADRARELVRLLLAEKFEEVSARFSPTMQKALPEATLKQAVAPFRQFGALKETLAPEVSRSGEYDIVIVPVVFERMAVNVQVTYNQSGQVDGLFFRPRMGGAATAPWQPPARRCPPSCSANTTRPRGPWPCYGRGPRITWRDRSTWPGSRT